tara:strand:- start:4180 stop:4458 length:279 start_codon:yes stop_codon:yes gene_type:complete
MINTLGTTMEEKLDKIIKDRKQSKFHRNYIAIHIVKDLLAQSKTDLLNALIDREEEDWKEKMTWSDDMIDFGAGYTRAKLNTINHLKSLRDE